MSIIRNRIPSVLDTMGFSQIVYTAYGRRTASTVRDLYRSVHWVYENSIGGKVITATWWIAISVIQSSKPTEQGDTGLPRFCTQPLADLRHPPPGIIATAPYSGCTKIPLAAECSFRSGHQQRLKFFIYFSEWWIAMSIIRSRTPSLRPAMGFSQIAYTGYCRRMALTAKDLYRSI